MNRKIIHYLVLLKKFLDIDLFNYYLVFLKLLLISKWNILDTYPFKINIARGGFPHTI